MNHRFYLLANKKYSPKKVQPKATPLQCRCREMPLSVIEILDDYFTVQKWHAHGCTAVGSLDTLKKLFDSLKKLGPAFGYHRTRCHIITNEHLFEKA